MAHTPYAMHPSAEPEPRSSLSTWIALAILVVLGGIQVYFYDITIHGPDQIRDMEIVRRLIHHQEWPLNGPPLFGERFHLPPGFYYLLAIPLLVQDTEAAVFLAFGALFALSVGYLWHTVRQCFGPRCAAVYAVLAFPLFASMYTHSAWNPALVMTFSNVVLGLFLRLARQDRPGGAALAVAAFLLVQIHPSAAPLLAGLALFALLNPKAVFHRAVLATLAILIAATAAWLYRSGALLNSSAPAAPATAQPAPGWLARLLDGDKWRDALLMPYSAIDSLQPPIAGLGTIAAVLLGLTLGGALLSLVFAASHRTIRWVWAITALWFLMSMAFLSQGACWHLDVIHPWLALLAAFGLSRTAQGLKTPPSVFHGLLLACFAMVTAGHLQLYSQFDKKGKYGIQLGLLFFPRVDLGEHRAPAYTFRFLQELRQGMADRGLCKEQLAGQDALVVADATNRALFNLPCPPAAASSAQAAPGYFMAAVPDTAGFAFTQGLTPSLQVGERAVYAVAPSGLRVNGKPQTLVLSDRKMNYMTFLPARLDDGLTLSVPARSRTLLRLALRCGRDYPVADPAHWHVEGAQILRPLVAAQARYLGSVYYDLEWSLSAASGSAGATVTSTLGPLDCDVSAIARTL